MKSASLCKIFFRCVGAIFDQEPLSKDIRAALIAISISETVALFMDVNFFPFMGETISKSSPDPSIQAPSIKSF